MDAVAAPQAFDQQMTQKALAREMFRRREGRVVQTSEFDLEAALLRDLERVPYRFRNLAKERLHFGSRAQVKLFRLVSNSSGIAQQTLRADANQTVMRLRMFPVDIVNVIGGDSLQPKLSGPRNQIPVDLRLLGDPVILKLKVEVLAPEGLPEPVDGVSGLLKLILLDQLGYF